MSNVHYMHTSRRWRKRTRKSRIFQRIILTFKRCMASIRKCMCECVDRMSFDSDFTPAHTHTHARASPTFSIFPLSRGFGRPPHVHTNVTSHEMEPKWEQKKRKKAKKQQTTHVNFNSVELDLEWAQKERPEEGQTRKLTRTHFTGSHSDTEME